MPDKVVYEVDLDELCKDNPARPHEQPPPGIYSTQDFISVHIPKGYTHVKITCKEVPYENESELPNKTREEGGFCLSLRVSALIRIQGQPDMFEWVEGQPFPTCKGNFTNEGEQ